ncbi:peptidoglycan-binding domain-containing protein [Streptomyces specialis]|uniref:peptidoglycan-binding domain-containing protein n=1 Tax=Streptomyces specialis TaxID=498367 RepID=UPI00073E77D9|nr:peptidoglycan-binding domain-containing protein [Streptomyces specialis]
MRLRTALIAVGALVSVGAGGLAASGFGGSGTGPAGDAPDGPPATAEVTTGTLTRVEEVTGTLGYGDPVTVTAPPAPPPAEGQPAGDGPGVVTWLAAPGAPVSRGEALYTVNAQPVPLLYGDQPLYRPLQPGDEGEDVELLERNLAELGYTGFTADDSYTDATAAAVEAWQDDIGREPTGTVAVADAAVAPGPVRVQQTHLAPGAPAEGPLLDITGTDRRIDVDLAADLEDLVAEGTTATVELPDGTALEAEVTGIGAAVAEQPPEGQGEAVVTIPLVLDVADQEALGTYQAAPVTVRLAAEKREDVLTVPVTALVALREGGYGLEVVAADGSTAYVEVTTGLFADGMVEVAGEGVRDGTVVGVPE